MFVDPMQPKDFRERRELARATLLTSPGRRPGEEGPYRRVRVGVLGSGHCEQGTGGCRIPVGVLGSGHCEQGTGGCRIGHREQGTGGTCPRARR